jgi:hypothetical protein
LFPRRGQGSEIPPFLGDNLTLPALKRVAKEGGGRTTKLKKVLEAPHGNKSILPMECGEHATTSRPFIYGKSRRRTLQNIYKVKRERVIYED